MKNFIFACALILTAPASAGAVTFTTHQEGRATVVHITGEIKKDDGLKFLEFIRTAIDPKTKKYVSRVVLDSVGGKVYDAHQIAQIVRAWQLDAEVPAGKECVSACFQIFTAGINLYLGEAARVGGQRLSIDGKETRVTNRLNRIYRGILKELGTPDSIVQHVMATPPARMYYLTPAEMQQLGVVAKK